ncbi:hypothetical protein ESA_01899 [Cronobacter sakazakii ATCC BAA-894]|uniref:Uncharacterized protein n=1 Tax=Cronobacter sakazakii (strain ATCC BAA-894) TaxID=290339 RepID=A7MK52_CROS8|nr:hypothetical protein ESA_01899 [Cronobacter sakazakii ATCC BAA-894]
MTTAQARRVWRIRENGRGIVKANLAAALPDAARQKAGDGKGSERFATAGFADQRHHFAAFDGQTDITQQGGLATLQAKMREG